MQKDNLSALLTELLENERNQELAFTAALPLHPAASISIDYWTLKDTLSHTAAWKLRTAARQLDWLAGLDLPVEEDLENANRSIYESCKNYSWFELLRILAAAHERMRYVVNIAGDDGLRRPGLSGPPFWTGVIANGVWHPLYHLSGWLFDQGQREEALGLLENFRQRLHGFPLEPRVHAIAAYDCGVLLLKDGVRDQAVARLREAFVISPNLKEWARQDPDLQNLCGDPVLD